MIWRIKVSDCIFCKIAAGELGTNFLYQSDEIVAFQDIHPRAPVHILIIPRRHIPKVSALADQDAELVGKLVIVARQIAQAEGLDERGYRLVFNCGPDSGQEVPHIHLHLLGGRRLGWPPG